MKNKIALAALALVGLSAFAYADAPAVAAAVAGPAPLDLQALIGLLHPILALALGCFLSTEGHFVLEGLISFIPNPVVRVGAKLFIGSIGAGVTAFFAQKLGISQGEAIAAWTGALGFAPTVKMALGQAKALGLTTDLKADVAKVGKAAFTPQGITEIAAIANGAGHPGLANVIREYGAALAAKPGDSASPVTAPVETVHYADGTTATGAAPLPAASPSGAPQIDTPAPAPKA